MNESQAFLFKFGFDVSNFRLFFFVVAEKQCTRGDDSWALCGEGRQ